MNLREALQSVYERNGLLTPHIVVEVARDGEDDVAQFLRERLPWDKDEALEQYQLIVAARLIRKVRVTYQPTPRSSLREVRAFVSVPSPSGRAYHPTDVVAQDPLMARLMLQEAERAWRDLKARYGNLSGFVAMIQHDLKEQQAA